jgi:peptide/nickel transport system substrate-binding protein
MPRSSLPLLAAASVLLAAAGLEAARRPRYGGTLRMETQAARGLEPPAWPSVFETLVILDESGRANPGLAVSWRRDAMGKRWVFRLRGGVKFHDGSPLTPETAAAALNGNGWTAQAAARELVVQTEAPASVADFADAGRAIALRAPDGTLHGTGPFRIAQWEARRALLTANDGYWGGRPFLDAISVEMGRTPPQQLLDLELGKADLIEVGPNEARRAAQSGGRVWESAPVILVALVFERGRPAVEDVSVREAVALSIDRTAIVNVLLQKHGEAASGLLPQWVSGYAVLFQTARDVARARRLAGSAPPLTLAYDPADPLMRMVAERVAVNAREAGIRIAPAPGGRAEIRLARARIAPPLAGQALERAAASLEVLDVYRAPAAPTLQTLYESERGLVEEFRVAPLVHLPEMFGATSKLKTWNTKGLMRTGEWRFDDLWLDPEVK